MIVSHRRVWLGSVTLALMLSACSGDSTTDEGATANVAGTWKGGVNATGAGQSGTIPQVFVLTQSGTTVTGTTNYDPPEPADEGTLTGTVDGSKFTFHVTFKPSSFDDCGNYPVNGTATVSGNKMTITGGTAFDCQGDGHGGHLSLINLTLTGGTLTKQ